LYVRPYIRPFKFLTRHNLLIIAMLEMDFTLQLTILVRWKMVNSINRFHIKAIQTLIINLQLMLYLQNVRSQMPHAWCIFNTR
jgi:hypothetical protein